jgi:hypothetical protein
MLYCFLPKLDDPLWRVVLEKIAIEGLRLFTNHPLFMGLLYRLLKSGPVAFGDALGRLPYEWILPFAEFNSPALLDLIPESFLIVIRPDLLPIKKSFDLLRLCEKVADQTIDNPPCPAIPLPLSPSSARVCEILPVSTPGTFTVRTTHGERATFYISREPLFLTPFATFLKVIGVFYVTFLDSAKRGQTLPYIPCAQFPNGLSITRTNAVPIPTAVLPAQVSLHWKLTFAYRYAGLCAVQYLIGAPAPRPDSVWADLPGCFAVVGQMEPGPADRVTFFIPPHFIDGAMTSGPFRAGLLSAGLCLAYEIEKVRAQLRVLLDVADPEFAHRCTQLSIADSGADSVLALVAALLARSGRAAGPAWL